MCCSSGVCGPSVVDPLLAAFSADVDWLTSQGVSVNPCARQLFLDACQRRGEQSRELVEGFGVVHQRLIVNGIFTATDSGDPLARALEARGHEALAALPDALTAIPRLDVPLLPWAPMGAEGLRRIFNGAARSGTYSPPAHAGHHRTSHPSIAALVDAIERDGHGVVLTMGKGGVGKTTVAAAIATELATRGHDVLLSTTDPAAHIADAIGDDVPHLRVTKIDPAAETRSYSDEVLAATAPTLDARGRDLLEEDLRSPCTEEIAVFRAFAQTVAAAEHQFVVLDTAPTGHTLLLLDAAEAYHREVLRTQGDAPDAVRQLLPRLRDPRFTKVLLVTLPEATPVHEAAQLQEDLRRARIEPFAWVVNQSLAISGVRDPILRERGQREDRYLTEVRDHLASRVVWVPWYPEPPVGAARLLELARGTECSGVSEDVLKVVPPLDAAVEVADL